MVSCIQVGYSSFQVANRLNSTIRTDANGKTGLDYIIQFIARLLQPAEEEGAALFVGTLIVKLIQKAGDKIVPVLGELLQAVAMKLESAKTATFIQVA